MVGTQWVLLEALAAFPGPQGGPKLCLCLLYPQHSNILGFIPRNKRRLAPDTIETTVPPAKKDLRRQMCPANPPTRSIAGSCVLPSRQEEGPTVAATAVLKPVSRQDGRTGGAEDPPHQELQGKSGKHPRAGANRNGLGQVFNKESKDQEARTEQPRLHSRATLASSRPCTGPQEPAAAHVSGQPLTMIFTRIHGDTWTSRFMEATPRLPNQKKTRPSESQASQEKGEGDHPQVPRSVLYEDLMVSCSEEEGNEVWAFTWKRHATSRLRMPRWFYPMGSEKRPSFSLCSSPEGTEDMAVSWELHLPKNTQLNTHSSPAWLHICLQVSSPLGGLWTLNCAVEMRCPLKTVQVCFPFCYHWLVVDSFHTLYV